MVVGEVGYFFFYKPKIKIPPQNNSSQQATPPAHLASDRLVNPDYIKYLSGLKRDKNRNYFLNILTTGYVASVSANDFEKNGRKFKGTLSLVDENNNPLETINFTEQSLNFFKFYKVDENNKKINIGLADIKPSQKISWSSVLDLTKDIRNDVVSNEIRVE